MKSYDECARDVLARIDEGRDRRRRRQKIALRLCAVVLFFAVAGVGVAMLIPGRDTAVYVSGTDLMEGITSSAVEVGEVDESFRSSYMDFSVKLFQGAYGEKGDNPLVSPLSVRAVLSMMSAGAKGRTLREFETMLGSSVEKSHRDMYSYMAHLTADGDPTLKIANSLWLPDDGRFQASRDFLQINADYYGAAAYMIPFDDSGAGKINRWVSDNTDGMIEYIIKDIDPSAVMMLVNAVAFEADWWYPFQEYDTYKLPFTTADGREITVEFMLEYKMPGTSCIENDDSIGVIKVYGDKEDTKSSGRYSFAAFMPKDENTPIDEYIASLTGDEIAALIDSEKGMVSLAMPKFTIEYDVDLIGVMSDMGIPSAFDPSTANLSGAGKGSGALYVSKLTHKTFIEVDETGTKAAATTIGGIDQMAITTVYPVTLDRPFVYMIIDNELNLPVFMGCVTEPLQE